MSLDVIEEADIVDSDDRLGGERPQQLDLLAAECYRFPPHDKDETDGLLFAHHRYCEDRAIAARPQEALRRREARVAHDVGDVDDDTVEQRASPYGISVWRPRKTLFQQRQGLRADLVVGIQMHDGAVERVQGAMKAVG